MTVVVKGEGRGVPIQVNDYETESGIVTYTYIGGALSRFGCAVFQASPVPVEFLRRQEIVVGTAGLSSALQPTDLKGGLNGVGVPTSPRWERKCEVEGENCDKLAVVGKAGTFKGSDVLYSAGDRIELVRFLSNADPLKLGGASFEAQNGKRVRPSASGLVSRATCGSCQYITVLVAVTTSFFPFSPFSALTCTLIMMDSFEYASLIFNSLYDPSHPLSPKLGLLHPRRSSLMGRSLPPRLARSPRRVRLDLIPHIRARNRQSAAPLAYPSRLVLDNPVDY